MYQKQSKHIWEFLTLAVTVKSVLPPPKKKNGSNL